MSPIFLPIIHARELDQTDFLQAEVAKPFDGWVFAMAHHPYISNGVHGNAGAYDGVPFNGRGWQQLLQNTICGYADVMFAGHDHDLQWLDPTSDCDTHFIISGAAGKTRSDGGGTNPGRFQAFDTFGFWWIQLDGDVMHAVAYDDSATLLYEDTLQR